MDDCAKVTHINDLPPELLVLIFSSYVQSEGNTKLYTILAKVSTKWRKAALSNVLWTEVSFTTNDFGHEYSWLKDKDFLAQISWVKTLNFQYSILDDKSVDVEKLVNSTLEPILENCLNLQNLNLNYCNEKYTPPFSFDLPTLCPHITGIRIHGGQPIPSGDVIFTWIEKYNTNLTSLIINRIFIPYSSHNLKSLSRKIAEFCPNLVIFKYLGGGLSGIEPEILDLNSLQAGCPKMKELCLENVAFIENDDLTSCFPHLEKFMFMLARIKRFDHDSQKDIVRVLRGSTELKELNLVGPIFKCKTMLRLPCKFIKKLGFKYSSKTDGLYDVLCRWKDTLTELEVWCSRESQQSLFRYIEDYGNVNLESFTLMNPAQHLEQIKSLLRPCAKLRYLQVQVIDSEVTECLLYKLVCLNTREEIIQWLNL